MGNLPSFSYNGFEIWCVFEAGLHLDQSHFKYSVALCGRGLPYWLKKWDTKISASRQLKTGIDTDVDMATSKMSGVCFPILWKNLDLVGKSNNFSPSLVRVLLRVRKLVECWNFPPGTRHCSERGAREDLFCFLGLWSCWEDFGWERMSLAVTLHDNLSISWLAMGSQELQSLQCPLYMDL